MPDPIQDNDKVKALYDGVSKDYNIGTYDEFKTKLQDPSKRKAFYEGVGKEYQLGTFEEFESKIVPRIPQTTTIDIQNARKQKQELETVVSNIDRPRSVTENRGAYAELPMLQESKKKLEQAYSQSVKSVAQKIGVNEDEAKSMVDDLADTPEEVFRQKGSTEDEILAKYKEEPVSTKQQLAAYKWLLPLQDIIKQDNPQGLVQEQSKILALQGINPETGKSLDLDFDKIRRSDLEKRNMILTYTEGYDESLRNKMLSNLAKDAALNYSGLIRGTENELSQVQIQGLDNDQKRAYLFYETLSPEEAERYKQLNVDPNKLTSSEKLGYQRLGKELKVKGIELTLNGLLFTINRLEVKYKKDGLSEQESALYKSYIERYEAESKKINDINRIENPNYQDINVHEAFLAEQDLGEQRSTGIDRFLKKVGVSVDELVSGTKNLIASPFRSTEGNYMAQLDAMGESMLNEEIVHVKPENILEQSYEYVLSKDFKNSLDAINNDKNLTPQQKRFARVDLINNNAEGLYKKSIDPKYNFSAKAIGNSFADMVAELLPFIATEGIGTMAGMGTTSSTFSSAMLTGFQKNYEIAAEEGLNPYTTALRRTAIQSAYLAGVGGVDAIKKMFKPKTAVGSLISKMRNEEIEAIIKSTPTAFKGVMGKFKDAGKVSLKLEGANVATELTNAAIEGKDVDISKMAEHFLVGLAKNTLLFGVAGSAKSLVSKDYRVQSDLDKLALFNAAARPKEFIAEVDKAILDGTVSESEGQQMKDNATKANTIFESLEFIDGKGKFLSEKAARELLFNKVKEMGVKEFLAKEVPPSLKEKSEIELETIKAENNLIYEPKTEKQLESTKNKLEKQLEEKDDNGKPTLNEKQQIAVKGELQAVKNKLAEYESSKQTTETTTKSVEQKPTETQTGTIGEPIEVSETAKEEVVPTKESNVEEGSVGVGGEETFYTGRGKKYDDLKNTKGEFIFFSKDPKISEWYGGDESNVSEAKLDTSDFLDLTTQESKSKFVKENFTDKDIEELYSAEIKHEEDRDIFGTKTREILIKKYRERAEENRFSGDGKEQQFLLKKIKEQGYSGVKLLDTHFGKSDISYVVIDKSKIKQSLKETPTPKGNTSNVGEGSVGVGGDAPLKENEYYHATDNNEILAPSDKGYKKREGNNVVGEGIYFGKDKEHLTDRYGENIIKVELDIKNPLVSDNKYIVVDGREIDVQSLSKDDINFLKEKGYDAIKYVAADKAYSKFNETIVFDKSQIKKSEQSLKETTKAETTTTNTGVEEGSGVGGDVWNELQKGEGKTENTAKILEQSKGTIFESLANAIASFVGKVKTHISNTDKVKSEGKYGDGKEYDGLYEDGSIKLGGKTNLYHFFHEAIHATTIEKIKLFELYKLKDAERSKSAIENNVNLTEKDVEAIDELNRIYEKVKGNSNKFAKEWFYGLSNVKEFVAEAFTNKEFQNYLKNTKSEGKETNLFKDFIAVISKVLGIKDKTILDDIFYHTEKLIEGDKAVKQSIKETTKSETPTTTQESNVPVSEKTVQENEMFTKREQPKEPTKVELGQLKNFNDKLDKDAKAAAEFEQFIEQEIPDAKVQSTTESNATKPNAEVSAKEKEAEGTRDGGSGTKTEESKATEANDKLNEKTDTKTSVEGGGKEPPKEKVAELVEEGGGEERTITHAAVNKLREKLGMPKYEGKETETHAQLLETAKELIKGGFDLKHIYDKIKNGDPTTNVENAIMAEYKAALDIELENNPSKETLAKATEFAEMSDVAGTLLGKGLESRKIVKSLAEANTLSNFLVGRERDKGHKLSDAQIKEETAKFKEVKAAEDAYEQALAKEKEADAKLIAEKGLQQAKKEKKAVVKKSHEEYVAERKSVVEKAKQALAELKKKKGGELTAVPLPFVKGIAERSTAIAPYVKDYVKSLLNEGIDKLDDIATMVHDEFKDVVDGLTKKDVLDIIGGVYDAKKETLNDKAAKLRLLKREAQLLNELAAARKGEEVATTETKKSQKTRRIEELENQIKEVRRLNKQRELNEEGVAESGDVSKISKDQATRKRLLKEIDKLQNDIKNKNYEKPEPPLKPLKLSRETQALQDKAIALRNKLAADKAADQREKMSGWEKAWDKFQNIAGVRRLVQTAFDASIWFRQLGSLALNPRKWDIAGKYIAAGSKSVFSEKNYSRIMDGIHKSPDFKETLEDGIRYNELDAVDPKFQNEMFQKSFIMKIPILKDGIRASQRIADASLNVARYELYQKYKNALLKNGITRESDPEMYKDMAKLVMNSTGSGNLLSALENHKAEKLLGATFYGARLMAANFNTLNPLYYAKMPKEVRMEAMKDLAAYTSTMMALGAGLAASGGKISLNPDDSDFLQVRFGEKVYDITSGKAAYIRTFLRNVEAVSARFTKTKYEANKAMEKALQSDVSFFRNKLSPNTGYAINALTGKSSIGKEFDPYEVAKIYPMYADDMYKAAKEDGFVSLLTVLLPNITGVGYGAYYSEPQKKSIDETIERNTNSDELNKETIKNHKEGGRIVTDKEFQQFADKRDELIKSKIKDLYHKGVLVTDEKTGEPVNKKYDQLTKEQIVKETSRIKSEATKKAKEELFGKEEKNMDKIIQERALKQARKEKDTENEY